MIWLLGIIVAVLVAWNILEARSVDRRLAEMYSRIRNARRSIEEHAEYADERHDTVIELIAQIAEARAPTPDPDDRTRRRPRKKAKP